jgi:ABC-type multidrug transport system ATPase subunit
VNIRLKNLAKKYKNEVIFKGVDFSFDGPGKFGVIGNNGSGKSTLLKTICGSTTHNKGDIYYTLNGENIPVDKWHLHFSLAAPYMDVIEDFTPVELFHFQKKFKPFLKGIDQNEFVNALNLPKQEDKFISSFSSGMKQRIRLVSAILADCPILFLDEPCSNMDQNGVQWYQDLLTKYASHKLVIIASNEQQQELFNCSESLDIRAFK